MAGLQFSNELELYRYIAENSTNPVEVARAYIYDLNSSTNELNEVHRLFIEKGIRITKQDFIHYGDK